jgi:hypothetical protein
MILRNQCQDQKTAAECGILHKLVAAAQDKVCICHSATNEESKATKRNSHHCDDPDTSENP